MYNPYQFPNYYQQQPNQNILPQQQIIQVNGKASVDTIQLAPNSSILVMDTSAPIVWMCISDGVGKVTSTPYDITVHEDAPPINVAGIEERITNIEHSIQIIEEKINAKYDAAKSNATKSQSRKNNAESESD